MAMDGAPITSSSSSNPTSSSTVATAGRWTYDAFLSFRGEDVRNNFVDHLYTALDRAGIYTFKDDEKLPKGELISPELVKAIEKSTVAVVIFSKNYANSSWCLDELAKIIECRELMGQRVLPVFYDVDPSDVRGQKGSFHTAFQQHEVKFMANKEKVKSWREALTTAANLSGWDVPKTASGREAECIKQIVANILNNIIFHPAEDLIGMASRVRDVTLLLRKGADDVCMIGIWGMGGIGKTTIARAVFHQISDEFEGSSFVEDVRENGSIKRGLRSLQEKLLSEILMDKHVEVKDCVDGASKIQTRLRHKKVFLILDDVDKFEQLDSLAGAVTWFGPGSRIMITTRNKHLLRCAQEIYAPELLTKRQAMELFSRYAFKANRPPMEYEKVSGDVVRHTGHLPLALKVLGSHFCGRDLEFWQSALDVLAKIPDKEINGILKLSFDGLNVLEKEIFQYIACIFKGKKRDYVTRILDSFDLKPISGITVLIEKSLLTIAEGNLHMHDLIQEMGWSIVNECHPNKMVGLPDEIKEVMTTITRLDTVEAIVENEYDPYNCPCRKVKLFKIMKKLGLLEIHGMDRLFPCCNAKFFKSMKELRLLEVNGGFTSNEPTCLPEQLRWLRWTRYPFRSLRITKGMTKLVGLELPGGHMEQLRVEKKIILSNLKSIDLRRSNCITMSPNVSGVPNLERLNLSRCGSLVEVHQSVGLHKRIVHLDLSFCRKLKILPCPVQMESLQTLNLSSCCCLKRLPEFSREMRRLLMLRLGRCHMLRALPSSMGLLTGLTFLTLTTYPTKMKPLIQSCTQLSSLRILEHKCNNLVEEDIPCNLHYAWPSLEELNLRHNIFTRLPASISRLSHLKYLNLSYCIELEELPELPSCIQVLKADWCRSLQKIGDLSNKYKWLFQIYLYGCPKLLKDQDSQSHVANVLMKSFVQRCASVNHRSSITVLGSKIPDWFSKQHLGNMIAPKLPRNRTTKMKGLAICCLCHPPEYGGWLEIKFKPADKEKLIDRPTRAATSGDEYLLWIGYMPFDFVWNLYHDFESEDIVISFQAHFQEVLECGVCALYGDDVEPMTGIGPHIPDYDQLGSLKLDPESATSEDIQHKRWSSPTFSVHEKTEDHKTVIVQF